MPIEKDISDFADNGNFLLTMKQAHELYNSPIATKLREINERSALYIEFLAAAFIKETGLKASECELVCEQLQDVGSGTLKFKWYFRKRE